MTIRNIDLRRKTGYKPRGKGAKDVNAGIKTIIEQEYRVGRTYEDYEADS